jgi:hypothetical protein
MRCLDHLADRLIGLALPGNRTHISTLNNEGSHGQAGAMPALSRNCMSAPRTSQKTGTFPWTFKAFARED